MHTKRKDWLSLLLLGLLVAGGAGHAAQAADGQSAVEPDIIPEVVVTARRKEENLQLTPISATVVTAQDIAAKGMTNVLDIARSAPSVTLMPGGNYSGKSALAYMRGVGQDQFTYAFEPGVGFYVDDVYFGSVYGSIFQLADISNVQVLRGPQGTLFGKNNEAGAILLYTPEPRGDGSGQVTVGYGRFNRQFIKASFDIPLVGDRLALGIGAASNTMDGYVDRLDFACARPGMSNLPAASSGADCRLGREGGDDERSFRATLKWTPNADFSMVLKGDLHDDTSEAGAETLLMQNAAAPGSGTAIYNDVIALAPLAAGGLNLGVGASSPLFVTGNPFANYSSFRNPGTGFNPPANNRLRAWDVSDKIEWRTPWGFQLRNVMAYQSYSARFTNTDPAPVPTYLEDNALDRWQFSDELQLSGTAMDGRLEWVGGLYFDKSRGVYGGKIELPTLEIVPGVFYGFNFTLDDPTELKSRSAFIHGIYHLTDRFAVEAGVRYSNDEKHQAFNHDFTASNPPVPFFVPGTPIYAPDAGGNTSSHRADPKVSLQYRWTPDFMTYASFATGYKMGGINPKPITDADIRPFGPEKLTAYEIGAKTEWLDHHLLLNVDAYLSDYRQIQLSQFLPPPLGDGGTIVVNAGHVRISGFEGEFEARLGRGLQLDATLSYLHYHVIDLGQAAGQVGGLTLQSTAPYVPRWQGSVGAQYTLGLAERGSLTLRADVSGRSRVYFDLANTPEAAQPGYLLTNVRLSWSDAQDKWSAAFEIANLTNKLYYLARIPALNADGSLFNLTGTPGMPRTTFFTVSRHF